MRIYIRKEIIPRNNTSCCSKVSLLIIILLLSCCFPVFAQHIQIKGNVSVDDNNSDVYYHLLIYAASADTILVSGASLNSKNNIVANVPEYDRYIVVLSTVGYKTIEQTVDRNGLQVIDLGELTFAADPILLEEITIAAKRPQVKMNAGKLVVDIKNTTLSDAGNLMDMLKRTPGLVQNGEGVVVPGKGTPLIFVDGRETNDPDILKSLTANNIESVEIDLLFVRKIGCSHKNRVATEGQSLFADF